MAESAYDYLFKIIVIGPSGAGKTNIIAKFTNKEFSQDTAATIGVEFSKTTMKVDYKGAMKTVRLQLWDTAGQERFNSIATQYYRGAKGALIIYDITSQKSFQEVEAWINEFKQNADEAAQVILCGNKCDLEQTRQVSKEEGQNAAQKNNLLFMETSALSGQNVQEAFQELMKVIIKKQEGEPQQPVNPGFQPIQVHNTEQKTKKSSCGQ